MRPIVWVSIKGIFRDRVFQGILLSAVLYLAIPSVSSLSMRQVNELAATLALSLHSFILLLLAVFLGGTFLWKDIDRRYTYSVLGLPISRNRYILGKFAGVSIFLLITGLFLGLCCFGIVWLTSGLYQPDRPIAWGNMAWFVVFDVMKYILLVAFSFVFATFSTSFFLPIFGTIAVFLVGGATQEVYDYIHGGGRDVLSPLVKQIGTGLYYVLPNFRAFDFKVNAIYGVELSTAGMGMTFLYFCVYVFILLVSASWIFSRRELQ